MNHKQLVRLLKSNIHPRVLLALFYDDLFKEKFEDISRIQHIDLATRIINRNPNAPDMLNANHPLLELLRISGANCIVENENTEEFTFKNGKMIRFKQFHDGYFKDTKISYFPKTDIPKLLRTIFKFSYGGVFLIEKKWLNKIGQIHKAAKFSLEGKKQRKTHEKVFQEIDANHPEPVIQPSLTVTRGKNNRITHIHSNDGQWSLKIQFDKDGNIHDRKLVFDHTSVPVASLPSNFPLSIKSLHETFEIEYRQPKEDK